MAHSVALIDDHHLVRSGFTALIDNVGGYRVTLEAANGLEFTRALNGGDLPDIAIVDLFMPVMDGFETLAWMKQHAPGIRALALTFDASDDVMLRAIRSGAHGFLLKNARPPMLKAALDSLMLTGYYHSDELHGALVDRQPLRTAFEREQERIRTATTPRELEFLQLVCAPEEYTYEQIAGRMGVHRCTVDGFRESLADKFGIKSKTGLVLFAMKWKLVDLEQRM